MTRFVTQALAAALATALIAAPAAEAVEIGGPKAFAFVALGDMPYKIPEDYARFEALIGEINKLKPAFSVHVGDIKAGSTPCTDENILKVKGEFDLFEQPLVYTIGDNEWTDCHREKAGKFNPVERLNKLREWFFAEPKSQGKTKLALERFADVFPDTKSFDGKGFVEITRFAHGGVLFVQPHIPGSNNNFETRSLENVQEFFARDKANNLWIEDSFAKAKKDGAGAVVISIQADMWDIKQSDPDVPLASGFVKTLKTIEKGAKDFGKPVLIVYGDAHHLLIQPFLGTDGKPVANVTTLMVPGEKVIGAVRIVVDPDNAAMPFVFQPIVETATK